VRGDAGAVDLGISRRRRLQSEPEHGPRRRVPLAAQPWDKAGWFTGSARPGQAGPAVVLGHVDSTSGPAVFYRLARLRPGDTVEVTRTDGTRGTFRVSGRQQVAKSRFPTDLVYGPTLEPSLRLVTCGGTFDRRSGHYRDNIIVSAVPA
jgi:sortase (surface protein transpeptidase)